MHSADYAKVFWAGETPIYKLISGSWIRIPLLQWYTGILIQFSCNRKFYTSWRNSCSGKVFFGGGERLEFISAGHEIGTPHCRVCIVDIVIDISCSRLVTFS